MLHVLGALRELSASESAEMVIISCHECHECILIRVALLQMLERSQSLLSPEGERETGEHGIG